MQKGASHFKTFPEFTKLTLAHRELYEQFCSRFQPSASLSFGTLLTWWSALEPCRIAMHGNNMVICLWYPGYDEYSGLTVLGNDNVDETFCAVFDFQRSKGQKQCLTHVPEHVVSQVRYPELFRFTAEREHDECIVDCRQLANIDALPRHKQWKLKRFLDEYNNERIKVAPLDLSSVYQADELIELVSRWKLKGGVNNFAKHEEDCLLIAIRKANDLGFNGLGMYLDGELHSFLILQDSPADDYKIMSHARFSYELPYLMEISIYMYARWFKEERVKFVNIEADSGFPLLRNIKLSLAPTNFLRMYCVRPVDVWHDDTIKT